MNMTFGKKNNFRDRARAGFAAFGLSLCVVTSAMADEVAITLDTFKLVAVVNDAGETVIERVALETALPGDQLLYRLGLENGADEIANDLSLELPIHEALIVAPESFVGDVAFELTFATRIAPEEFMAFPELVVPAEDGSTRPATPEDLGAVRVLIAELSANQAAFVEYEATLR